jgi:murein DD-endopeptidase MepM/ murein hydrolase activator NlpD
MNRYTGFAAALAASFMLSIGAAVMTYAQSGVSATPTVVLLPTNTSRMRPIATSTPSPTRTLVLLPTNTPRTTVTPAVTETLGPPTYTPTSDAPPGATWTPPAQIDPASQIADHYFFQRPIPNDAVNYIAWTYPYGSTAGGRLQVHRGVDLVNPTGTSVLAPADGTVLYAGDDLSTLYGPYNNYYGNMIVIQHALTDGAGLPVYTLYGHLDRVEVTPGQAVTAGARIGTVGGTGIAQGPHLHFEVRVGNPYDFGATRNPALWIRPYFTFGTLAGRVVDAAGNLLYDATLIVEPQGSESRATRYAFTYADGSVNGDSVFGENYVLGDLPAGYYQVTLSDSGRVLFRETVYVANGRTTWLEVRAG